MDIFTVVCWRKGFGPECVSIHSSYPVAVNAAIHRVEDFIRYSGCGGDMKSGENNTFYAENNQEDFMVRICFHKMDLDFSLT